MVKPYSIFKRSTGIYYVQFRMQDGSRSSSKSTGTRNRTEAEKIAMEWVVNGSIPTRINASANKKGNFTDVSKIDFLNALKTYDFTQNDVKAIITVLKERKYINFAVQSNTPEAKPLKPFLLSFWTYDNSPYVKEKLLRGQSIHRSYCETMKSRVTNYWLPLLEGRSIGSITRDDIKAIFDDEKVIKLAPKTKNYVVSAITIPLKWAYYNGYTENNCFDGIIKCANKSKPREILTLEQAYQVFSIKWENDAAKLANEVAFYTGMRAGYNVFKSVKHLSKEYTQNTFTLSS